MSSSSHYKPSEEVKKRLMDKAKATNPITIKPNALEVTWGRDSRYWKINETDDESSIELNQVSWLEVTGGFPSAWLSNGTYTVTFQVSLTSNAFGWQGSPVYFFVMDPNIKKRKWKKHDLNTLSKNGTSEVPTDLNFVFKESNNDNPDQITFGLYEIWKGGWKGGLKIHGVLVKKS